MWRAVLKASTIHFFQKYTKQIAAIEIIPFNTSTNLSMGFKSNFFTLYKILVTEKLVGKRKDDIGIAKTLNFKFPNGVTLGQMFRGFSTIITTNEHQIDRFVSI